MCGNDQERIGVPPRPEPGTPAFKEVGPEDRARFEEFFDRFPQTVCEMNFPNIFIWKDSEHPRWSVLNGGLAVVVRPDFEEPYALPPAGADNAAAAEALLDLVPRLSRVPEGLAAGLAARGFAVEEDRDNFDYVYRTADLAELAGKRFDGKRNRIRKFERTFRSSYQPLAPEHSAGCLELLKAWSGEREGDDASPDFSASRRAVERALTDHPKLGMFGAVVLVDGRVGAFTMASRLNRDTAVVQIEFADQAFPGLAQWINREFVRRELGGFTFVNREQDLGLPGLRKAKMSYAPVRLEKKFDIRRIRPAF